MAKNRELSELEFQQMIDLLHRYINTNMDQWEAWKIPSKPGTAYIDISVYPKASETAYTDLSDVLTKAE